jgi:hypothetical protein
MLRPLEFIYLTAWEKRSGRRLGLRSLTEWLAQVEVEA